MLEEKLMKTTVNITNTRQWDRHALGVPIAFGNGDAGPEESGSYAVTKNVSAGGVLVVSPDNMHEVGESVVMEFIIPDDEAPKIRGTVLRTSKGGMAIEFINPHPWLIAVIAN